MRCDIVVVASS